MRTPETSSSVTTLDWDTEGSGPAVVLVHGALADRRLWKRHLPLLAAAGYRAMAVTLPHHGAAPLPSDTKPFGLRAHTDALAEFLVQLADGPVHLVAWSYSAHAALTLAVEHPGLLRSVFAYEPGFPTWVDDDAQMRAFSDDVQQLFAPVGTALSEGQLDLALERLIDGSAARQGHFAAQSSETRQVERENAHTLPQLLQQTSPPHITQAQLRNVRLPVCVAAGALTRPAYAIVAQAAHIALPRHALWVQGAGHMWPDEQPADFCRTVLDFLRQAER